MGWTFYHLDNPNKVEEVRNLYTWESGDATCRVVDITTSGNVVYAAVHYRSSKENYIHAAVVLTANRNDWFNFGYKAMSEDMWPGYTDCPKHILDKLTPTNNEYALEWRKACEDKRKRKNALARLKEGTRIMSGGKPLRLVTMSVRRKPKKYWLIEEDGAITYTYVKQSWILQKGWEVIK